MKFHSTSPCATRNRVTWVLPRCIVYRGARVAIYGRTATLSCIAEEIRARLRKGTARERINALYFRVYDVVILPQFGNLAVTLPHDGCCSKIPIKTTAFARLERCTWNCEHADASMQKYEIPTTQRFLRSGAWESRVIKILLRPFERQINIVRRWKRHSTMTTIKIYKLQRRFAISRRNILKSARSVLLTSRVSEVRNGQISIENITWRVTRASSNQVRSTSE